LWFGVVNSHLRCVDEEEDDDCKIESRLEDCASVTKYALLMSTPAAARERTRVS
jgi:hypothetical protein